MVKLLIGAILIYSAVQNLYALCPRCICHIPTRLHNGILHDIHRHDASLRVTLRSHNGYKPRTCTHIEDTAIRCHICPRTKKHTIGAYLHRGMFILYRKVLKPKHR